MLHCRNGIDQVVSGAWFNNAWHSVNLCYIRPENFVSHGLQVPFGETGSHVPFTEEWFLSGYSTMQA